MKLLLVQCAALGHTLVQTHPELTAATGLAFRPLTPPFPAVTCTASATMRTAAAPAQHGIIANGRYDRAACKVEFWLQSARLCRGPRIWQRCPGCRAAMIFHQQNLGEQADIVLSPWPVHKHHGGMIQACQTTPPDLEKRLNDRIGRPFDLMRYWGPLASIKSSDWIAQATIDIMENDSPDLLLTYIPHLDYVLQKFGPAPSRQLDREYALFTDLIARLLDAARANGYEALVWGDYAIVRADQPVYLNRALRDAGLFRVRTVGNGLTYPNLYDSPVVAMADHQVAHLYVQEQNPERRQAVLEQTRRLVQDLPGVAAVQTRQEAGLDTPEAGDLIATAEPHAWFTYRWWDSRRDAPDYATHIDIHSKIGFDPCELFSGFPPLVTTSMEPERVRGTHGRADEPAAFSATPGLLPHVADARTLTELSARLRDLLQRQFPGD